MSLGLFLLKLLLFELHLLQLLFLQEKINRKQGSAYTILKPYFLLLQ